MAAFAGARNRGEQRQELVMSARGFPGRPVADHQARGPLRPAHFFRGHSRACRLRQKRSGKLHRQSATSPNFMFFFYLSSWRVKS